MPQLKLGSQGQEVFHFYDYFVKYSASYASLLGSRDGYYGNSEAAFTNELQRRLGVPATGRFGDLEASKTGYKWIGTTAPPVVAPLRPIWIYSAPGSGGQWFQGPSFDLGERCLKEQRFHHQPLGFMMGGYLGLLGGDPTNSYVDVTYDQYKSLEYNLDNNPQINDPNVEFWFSGYSQSADGMEDALEILFGDGGFTIPKTGEVTGPGKYKHLRSRINGVIQFGNPSKKDTGIARKVRPAWLNALISNINYDNDFYAVATDNIRPAMYAIIIEANMSLPFFVHVLRLGARIIPEWLTLGSGIGGGGLLGGILGGGSAGGPFGQLGQIVIGGLAGVGGNSAFGQLFGMAGGPDDTKVDNDLYNLLGPMGILKNFVGMIQLIGALPGLQAHGNYPFDPVMMDRSYQVISSFRKV